jgi:hypothetical protein
VGLEAQARVPEPVIFLSNFLKKKENMQTTRCLLWQRCRLLTQIPATIMVAKISSLWFFYPKNLLFQPENTLQTPLEYEETNLLTH